MKRLTTVLLILLAYESSAQIFDMRKAYTGYHFAFSPFKETPINQFIVQFNQMWRDDLAKGFHQYSGNELGQSFTTSGFRFIWGKNRKWTASTDYAFGAGKDKNEAEFKSGIIQHLRLRVTNHQVNASFGVSLKENKVWLEGLYSTCIGKAVIEYSTEYQNGVTSFGTEYKLNGVYSGNIKTMQLGVQSSYKYKKYVFYARALFPIIILGPDENARNLIDEKSSQPAPNDFPSDYNTYINQPQNYNPEVDGLLSTGFKGMSYGFGMFYLIGKDK